MIRMIQTAVMIIVHHKIATVIQVVLQRRNIAIHTSLMMMDMKMFIWMMIMTMTDIIVIQIMQME